MALHEPLEITISTPRALRSRPPLSSLMPAADAVMLLGAAALLGFSRPSIAYAVVAFLILNGDTSRRFRLNPRFGDEAGWLLGRVSIALLVLVSVGWSVSSMAKIEILGSALRGFTLAGLTGSAAVFLGRAAAYALERAARTRGIVSERTLIVGDGEMAMRLVDALEEHPEYGLRPVGFLGRHEVRVTTLPYLGESKDLQRVIRDHEVRRVLVAFGEMLDQELVTILRANERASAEIHVVPRFFELSGIPQGAAVDDVCGIPLLHLRRPALRPAARLQKRAFDIVVASLLLLVSLPLLAILALAVRLSSPGPVLFRQKRVGLNGQLFEIYKFRTMYENDDSDTAWLSDDDRDRVTGVGHLLRRTSLDEVPQLLNVLRGEMSLVGPRPERPHYTGQFTETVSRYDDRHRVVGGITGWAQINGRNRGFDTVPQRARLDNYYIENWSLWRDLVIIARTIGVLFRGR
ncbi:MAG: sugar transferase [Actinomycetota bacterium]|nr:sugar transferase [Actinomycetota bacterium]